DVHAAVLGHVDVMALAELAHLRAADSEEGEHPALRGDEAEVALRAVLPELPHRLLAQAPDALAHGVELQSPRGAQRRLGEDLVHDRGAVIRGHRPDAARDAHQLTESGVRGRRRLVDDVQRAGALAIESEVLRAGRRAQHLGKLGAEQAHRECVRLQACAEALVGVLTCTTESGAAARMSSAPSRSAPQPPGACTVRTRAVTRASCWSPRTSRSIASLNAALPEAAT